MKFKHPCAVRRIASALVGLAGVLHPRLAHAAETGRTIVIVANDSLRFSVTRMDAHPGEKLHVQLRDEGSVPKVSMGHNWILLDEDSEATPYAMAAMTAQISSFMVPALASHVLASIALIGPKERGDVTFNAPMKPGSYPFICSFPGHMMAGMRGELVVK